MNRFIIICFIVLVVALSICSSNQDESLKKNKRSSEWGLLNDLEGAIRDFCIRNVDCIDRPIENYCCSFQCCNLIEYIFRDE
jgi:hypothetical protein